MKNIRLYALTHIAENTVLFMKKLIYYCYAATIRKK